MAARIRIPRRGFTFIELLVVAIIVGIVALIAVPSFTNQLRKGKRSEARVALHGLMQAQEKFRSNCTQYASTLAAADSCSGASSSVNYRAGTETGLYALAISSASDTGFSASATAQGSQVDDAACAVMTLSVAAGNVTSGPAECW